MTPVQALLAARQAGLSVRVQGDKLRVEWPADMAPPAAEVIDPLRAHRDRLVQLLTLEATLALPRCRPCGRAQHVPDYICPQPSEPDPQYPLAPGYGLPADGRVVA